MRAPVPHLYVHAPFCARRCFYCDFPIAVNRRPSPEGWISAIRGELRALAREGEVEPADPLRTLYVGGGTPSLLGPEAMEALAGLLGRGRLSHPELEWTAEANPESFTPEVARGWRGAGVNRVSLGVQTFHGPALRWMGRLHGPEGAVEAVRRARAHGFRNVNVDLIFGLPRALARSWREDLDRALALDVPHLSLYGLTVEEGTPLARAAARGRVVPPDEEAYAEEYLEAAERLRREGYRHYEVSNFARPGFESVHNRACWEGAPYLGLGNGAHTFVPPLRRWNLREWPAYSSAVARGELPVAGRERLDPDQLRLERIWLGLRTAEGLAPGDLGAGAEAVVGEWVRRGWAEEGAGRVRLTPSGWLLVDRLAVELDRAAAP